MGFENSNKNGPRTDGRRRLSLSLYPYTYVTRIRLWIVVGREAVSCAIYTRKWRTVSFEIRRRPGRYGPQPAARLVYPVKVVAFAFPVAVAGLRLKARVGRIRENKNTILKRPTTDERFTNTGRHNNNIVAISASTCCCQVHAHVWFCGNLPVYLGVYLLLPPWLVTTGRNRNDIVRVYANGKRATAVDISRMNRRV